MSNRWALIIAVLAVSGALACSVSLNLGSEDATPSAEAPSPTHSLGATTVVPPTATPAATPTQPPPPTPTVPNWPVVLADDFDDSSSGFAQRSAEDSRTFYEGGLYHIEILQEDGVAWNSRGSVSDFVAEVDVISSGETGGAGIVFRNQADGRQFYLFAINVDGSYWLRMLTPEGWELVRDWQESPHVRTGAASNHLQVVCVGPEISLFANGQYLETVQDTTYSSGSIGMLAGTSVGEPYAHFSFDGLRVHGPAPGEVLFSDDFADPSSGWTIGGDEEGEVGYEQGELRIRDYAITEFATVSQPGLAFTDLIMEVESQLVEGTENNWLGHYCRYVDASNYYVLAYSSDGYYTGYGLVDGERTDFASPTPSDAVLQGVGAVNLARLECVGTSIRFWVNGELLIDVTDARLVQGDIALDAEAEEGPYTEVAYDNLAVRAP